jgi:amino acid adenylation domain-containing protein
MTTNPQTGTRKAGLSDEQRARLEKRLARAKERTVDSSSIPRCDRRQPIPLSFAQQRLWFLDQLVPANPFYNISTALHINAVLNVPVLRATLNEIVRRHEALRTTFEAVDGQPVQVIAPVLYLELPITDLRGIPEALRDAEALRLASEEANRPFDLRTGPLIRASLLQVGVADFIFLLTIHHIVSDGWSMGIFSQELIDIYCAFGTGRPSPLPELLIQYADFAVWQRRWFQGEVLQRQLEYWRRRLADVPQLRLALDRPRPSTSSYRGDYYRVHIPLPLTQGLKELSRRQGCTLFMTLMAGFKALLARYTEQDDIVVGAPIANRNHREIEGLIGFFVNSLVFRTKLSGDPTFTEIIGRVKEVAQGAYSHQDLPFETLVDAIQQGRDLSKNPLFQVTFQLVNTPGLAPQETKGNVTLLNVKHTTSIFDMAFSLFEFSGGLIGGIEYNTDCFDGETIVRFARNYQSLLESAVNDPGQRLSELTIMPESERHRQLVAWNATDAAYPLDRCLHELFEDQVERTPEAVAVVSGDGLLSYGDLNDRSNRLAHFLRRHGVGPDTPVVVAMHRSRELVVALLGVLKAGGAYVPLDPNYPRSRLELMLDETQAPVLLTQESVRDRLTGRTEEVVCVDSRWREIEAESQSNPAAGSRPEDLAYIMFTSGSTGRPKGAMIPHLAICNHMHWMLSTFPLTGEDRVLQRTPICFDASVWEFWAPLLAGARLVLADPSVGFDGAELSRALSRHGITTLQLVPTLLWLLLDEPASSPCPSLRRVFCGGEVLTPAAVERFVARFGDGVELCNLYGPTEATIDATSWRLTHGRPNQTIPIGRPISNTKVYVLDSRMAPYPIGVPGELYIGGVGLARGYLHRPDLTAQSFVPDPFSGGPEGRLYRSGDLVRYRPEGDLEFLGRRDDQVKVHGVRIELAEVESAVRQVPGVREAAVAAREDRAEGSRLVAYVIPTLDDVTTRNGQRDGATDHRLVEQWRELYDDVYRIKDRVADPGFDTRGWNSSDTGAAIPEREMREWVERTVERLRQRPLRRVLEIGCGTGLILFRLAAHCESYCGIDFSTAALRAVREHCERLSLGHVRLICARADELSTLVGQTFDTVVLNSVVQYFPSVEYLVDLLRGVLRLVEPGGRIFVGDVRNRDLLDAFHTAVELSRAESQMSVADLRARVRRQIEQEAELVLSPSFFPAVAKELGRITHVQLELKRGQHWNEMTRFRYDVTLHVDADRRAPAGATLEPWTSLDETGRRLDHGSGVLGLGPVPDARVEAAVGAWRLLNEVDPGKDVGRLCSQLAGPQVGIDPESLWQLAESRGYTAEIGWRCPGEGEPGTYDVLLWPGTRPPERVPALVEVCDCARRSWSEYGSNPLRGDDPSQLVRRVREMLRERLPEAMVPSAVVVMSSFPLTPNGKLDRRALPEAGPTRDGSRPAAAARTERERRLIEIWAEVLRLDSIGIHDNFFTDLGGNSLLATQLVARVRKAFDMDLPLIRIFESPTIAELAVFLGPADAATKADAAATGGAPSHGLPPITRRGPEPVDLDHLSEEKVDEMLKHLLST